MAEDRADTILRGIWTLEILRGLHLGPSILDEETKVQRRAGTCCNHTAPALMCPHLNGSENFLIL